MIVYRSDIVCPAELPVLVTGFKSQQRRWAMGSIQTALKLLPAVWRAELPLWTRYQAFVHLTYYVIHPLMLTSVLLSIPLRATSDLAAIQDFGSSSGSRSASRRWARRPCWSTPSACSTRPGGAARGSSRRSW